MGSNLIQGFTGYQAEVDSNKNLQVTEGLPAHPTAGGYYGVTGGPAAVVAAALAIDTSLVSMRFSASSTRKAYLTKFVLCFIPSTLGAAAGVGGSLGLQRFTTATPTGGTARTVDEKNASLATATDMTDVRDNNAALTVTSVVFGNDVVRFRQPLYVASGGETVFTFEPTYPVVLSAGDGLVLRTRVALAATETWAFDWWAEWYEK